MPDAISAFGFLIPVVRASVILGLVVAGWLAVRFSKLTGDAAKKLESAVFGVTVAGLVGARLGFVVLNWNAFQNNLLSIFYVCRFFLKNAKDLLMMLIGEFILQEFCPSDQIDFCLEFSKFLEYDLKGFWSFEKHALHC